MALSLGRAVAKTPVRAAQLNQIIDFLEGASSENIALMLRSAAASDAKIVLADAAGVRQFQILDSAEAVVFSVNSNGDVTITGNLTTDPLIVPGEAAPTATALGNLRFDEDEFFLTIGTGAATKRLGLVVGAGALPALTGEMAYDTTSKQLLLHNGTGAVAVNGSVAKYVVTNQVFTANTTFADVVANGSPATMSFPIGANQVFDITLRMYMSYSTTGGFKLQLTGPASPTRIIQQSLLMYVKQTGLDSPSGTPYWGRAFAVQGAPSPVTLATAFFAADSPATAVERVGSATVVTEGTFMSSVGLFEFRILYFNGATAGTVTVQAAQNSAAGTTTVGADSVMVARMVGYA